MLLRLDPHSAEPIYEQIVFQVKSRIARGELKSGDQLASVRELAKDLAINPNTVARSYAMLESQGVIVRRQGAGCFVTGNASVLKLEERRRQLAELVDRTVTEAFHLGFDAEAVRAALERRLRGRAMQEGRR